jgi:hypothetical protein
MNISHSHCINSLSARTTNGSQLQKGKAPLLNTRSSSELAGVIKNTKQIKREPTSTVHTLLHSLGGIEDSSNSFSFIGHNFIYMFNIAVT